jgi:hypothetical protein
VWQRWRYTLGTFFNIVGDLLPAVAMAATFVFYTKVQGRDLDPATAFVALVVWVSPSSHQLMQFRQGQGRA